MPGKPLLSLTTRDIAGATPTPLERFTNKPPKEEVAGSKSKSSLLGWNRPVMNLETHDISGNDSGKSHFLANSTRSVNPLNPTYALPAVRPTPTPEPKFLRNTLDWTDVPGMKPRDFYSKQPRDQISCADIEGSGVGTTPRSKARKTLSKRRPVTSLDVHDISGGKFVSTRITNPLDPEYVMRCESSLGYMGRGAAEHARKSKMDTLERKPSLHTTNLERPNPDTERLSASEKLLASTGSGPTALMKVGKVERSHPGWRPTYANKYYENGVRMKDASLRSDDIPGTKQLPSNSFLITSGGVWRKTERSRRGVRNSIPTDDIDDGGTGRGAQAMLKKDSMHRSLGRQSDPGDPVYIPLDGVQKAGGLLEREILSKTVNARKSIQTSHAINPDENVARQLARGGRLSDSLLQSAFKSADLRNTGKVSYPTFVQGINALGVAMPAKDVVELAKQLDTEGTGQVDYSKLPGHLKQAYEKRVKFEAEETAKRLSMVEKKSEPATSSISPMMKLKDKLYRKNEKLYKSFGMFDLDKQGSITTERFADTVDMLNIGCSKETSMDLAREVDFQRNGIITYFEFANKMDYTDDFARPEDKIGPPKTPEDIKIPTGPAEVKTPPKAGGAKKPPKSSGRATPNRVNLDDPLAGTAMSIDLGNPAAAPQGRVSKQHSHAGSGRATPMNLRPLDSKTAYQMLEVERAVEAHQAELSQVAALPDGTPRRG